MGYKLDIHPHTHDCILCNSGTAGSHSHIYPNSKDNDSDWEDNGETLNNDSQTSAFYQLASDLGKTVIVASTGIFKHSLQWCTCLIALERHIQLLRARLFPATFISPKTAFTFEVLDHFHLDALECQTSAMNFMSKLHRRTNEIFPGTVLVRINRLTQFSLWFMYPSLQNRYQDLLHVSQEWRDLRNHMCGGQAHDHVTDFVPGALALFCPACPQLGINIPLENEWKGEERCVHN